MVRVPAGKLAAAAAASARLDGMDLIAAVASKFGVAGGLGLATRQVAASEEAPRGRAAWCRLGGAEGGAGRWRVAPAKHASMRYRRPTGQYAAPSARRRPSPSRRGDPLTTLHVRSSAR